MGLVSITGGSITYDGTRLNGLDTQKIVGKGIVLVPEGRRVFPNLTTLENLRLGGYLQQETAVENNLERVYGLFPRLKERHWQLAGTLSGGEQQMLAVGRALMANPRLIMMDEPSLGLAPLVVKEIFSIIKRINEAGVTVLLIEQNANIALKTATRGYVLQTGTIILEEPVASCWRTNRQKLPTWAKPVEKTQLERMYHTALATRCMGILFRHSCGGMLHHRGFCNNCVSALGRKA